jgi:cytochrome b561
MYFSLQPDQTIRKETCIDDGWEFWNPHALLGFITVGLCFLQPFLALVRCAPSHRHRAVFNWLHWLVGNSAQILAIVCIFYAVDLDKAQLPRPETDWLLVAFVAFHFLSHLLLSCLSCRGEASNSKR